MSVLDYQHAAFLAAFLLGFAAGAYARRRGTKRSAESPPPYAAPPEPASPPGPAAKPWNHWNSKHAEPWSWTKTDRLELGSGPRKAPAAHGSTPSVSPLVAMALVAKR